MQVLQQIKKNSLSDIVEEQLRSYIREKGLVPGDSLPGEIELTERLGVSRSVLREALSRLRSLGLLESKQRRGLFVTEPPILTSMARIIDTGVMSEEVSRDLFELRLVVELGIADLIFMFVTADDIEALEDIVAREKKCQFGSADALACEIDFHKTLYKISGNETILNLQKILGSFFRKARHMLKKKHLTSECTVHHEDLLNLIKKGDCNEFITAMRIHLKPQFDLIRK